MLDPFLTGLVAGAALGAAGLSSRLVRLAALAGLALLAWAVAQGGSVGLEEQLSAFVTDTVLPHGRLLAGAAVGTILGGALVRALRGAA